MCILIAINKMKIFFLIILILASCSNQKPANQLNKVEETASLQLKQDTGSHVVTIFLDPEFTGKVDVFKEPNGRIIKSVQNNDEDDTVIMFALLGKTDNMYYVIAYSGIDDSILAKGWIYKKNHLGIYSSAYGHKRCSLYEMPSNKAKIVLTEKEYNPDVYQVLDFEGKWLKVQVKNKSRVYVGWMPPEMQCANPYTTCS